MATLTTHLVYGPEKHRAAKIGFLSKRGLGGRVVSMLVMNSVDVVSVVTFSSLILLWYDF